MKVVNFFSHSCAVFCFSSNNYLLRIARWDDYIIDEPISVTAVSKAWVCGRLFAWGCGFEFNRVNPFLSVVSVVCCQSSLRRADLSSRGVLPSVLCLTVTSKMRDTRLSPI
jgi:hypothetical protein